MNALLAVLVPPRSPAARRRWTLVVVGCALAGSLLVFAARVARATWENSAAATSSPFVAEDGLRAGTVVAGVLFAVPALALALQALQLGADVRARRGRALVLAGATAGQVRLVAAAEAAVCAGLGGLLAGPGYLLLHLLLGLPPERTFRLALPLQAADAVAWLGVTVVLAAAGAVVASRTAPELRSLRRRPGPGGRWVLAALLLVVVAVGVVLWLGAEVAYVGLVGLAVLALVGAVALGAPALLTVWARLAVRDSDAVGALVAHRLVARPGIVGRVCAVLVAVGLTLGVTVPMTVELFRPDPYGTGRGYDDSELLFYAGGTSLVGVLALLGAVLVLGTLGFSLADDLGRSARQLASLRALGVSEGELRRVLARQASAGAVPAVVLGALLPAVLRFPTTGDVALGWVVTAATVVVAGLLVRGACSLLALALTSPLRRACATENLRTA